MYNFTDGSICGTIPNLDLQDLEAAVAPDAEVGPHAVAGELPDLARAAARVLDVAAGVGHVVTQDVAPVLEPGVEVVGAAAPDIEFFNFNIDIHNMRGRGPLVPFFFFPADFRTLVHRISFLLRLMF